MVVFQGMGSQCSCETASFPETFLLFWRSCLRIFRSGYDLWGIFLVSLCFGGGLEFVLTCLVGWV